MLHEKNRRKVSIECIDQIFTDARTHHSWLDQDVPDSLLQSIFDLTKLAPTSANCSPIRVIFIRTPEAKERLKPHLMEGNIEQTMSAPVTAILGYDLEFYEHLPRLFPYTDARSWFVGKEAFIEETAFINSSLQGGYFMLAARALGLDCGPMSGFNPRGVENEFFPDGKIKANFLCNLGYGNEDNLPGPRAPRHAFDEVCTIL